jgi:hypothetical protein
MDEVTINIFRSKLTVDFNLSEGWNAFELIADILQKYFHANSTEKIDGPESGIWSMTIDDAELILLNNPYGSSLKPCNSSSNTTLRQIFDDWTKYSKL